jgi:hypothetical protein
VNEYFHGTSLKNALEIKRSKCWVIGRSTPHAIYLTIDIGVAVGYADNHSNPAVILIKVKSGIRLEYDPNVKGKGIATSGKLILKVPNSNPDEIVYLPELQFLSVFDRKGNLIE